MLRCLNKQTYIHRYVHTYAHTLPQHRDFAAERSGVQEARWGWGALSVDHLNIHEVDALRTLVCTGVQLVVLFVGCLVAAWMVRW